MLPAAAPEGPTVAREELACALTHGAGLAASVAGGIALVAFAVLQGDAWRLAGAAVFALALVLLFTTSTLFHFARDTGVRARLRVLDHCAIFVLIAGTYTPFTLVGLRGAWGWALLATVWTLAAAGIAFKLVWTGRFRRASTVFYLSMGWLAVLAAGPAVRMLPGAVIAWLVAGGLAYTVGTYFYHNRRIPYSHAIWHLFVLGGSACHFVAVMEQLR
jgi:hemolysin III